MKVCDRSKKILEALLFSASTPLTIREMQKGLSLFQKHSPEEVKALVDALNAEYQERAFAIEEKGGGFLLQTKSEYSPFLRVVWPEKRSPLMSRTQSEVLAIIAYRQPVTRASIEAVRGVESSASLQVLIDRGFVEYKGQLETPGRPNTYGTTPSFLVAMGLKSLEELPPMDR